MSKTYQLTNTGDLSAIGGMEINEISYAGKGNGTNVYINTGIPANEVNFSEIVFKYIYATTTQVYYGVFGGGTSRYHLFKYNNGLYMAIGNQYTEINLTPYITTGNIYKLSATKDGANYIIIFYEYSYLSKTFSQVYTQTVTRSVTTNDIMWIYNRNGANAYLIDEIYSFQINNETWYINNGTGSTITGNKGTELTVNGTLTSFWQVSEIWNYPSNFLMGNDGTVRCEEFIEDDTLDVNMRINTNDVTVKNEFLEI